MSFLARPRSSIPLLVLFSIILLSLLSAADNPPPTPSRDIQFKAATIGIAGGSGIAAQDVNRRLNRVEIERDLRQMNRDLRSSDPRPTRAVRRAPVGTRHPGVSRGSRR